MERTPLTDKEGRQKVLTLFGLTSGKDGIVAQDTNYRRRFAGRCIPFADDGLGNLFVIDTVTGQIKFWHHKCQDGETNPKALALVAKDFDAFLSNLDLFKEEHSPALLQGIKNVRLDF
ncbi:SMI1/KNR4 family protein SUKH-1 [Pacificibacter maritimus]|uniref:SMI1/KNR4 family protein SUKH-1 n=1 Tax=Pacificibacter maritimus TaxID=762213 RepID=A0A3N4UCC7_9RHOB|nr:SMI1/KNR4 family protein [Pacificibacter maritimus]RPE67468.1 SMI1/KNR4 family protein SUKH-1 [Pacificibacter maritimus]